MCEFQGRDLLRPSLRRLTTSSTCGIPASSFVEPELVKTRSFDELEVPSYLYLPKTGSPPFPLIDLMHGGPESQFRPGFSPLIQFFISLGFGVLATNFRGSTGYGRRYTHLDDVQGRMDTVRDAELALRHVLEKYPVDPKNLAAWGGSYGGFMVLASLYTNPSMWAAGVDIVGISNFVTFLKKTGPWRRKLRIAEYGDPEKDKDYLEGSLPTTTLASSPRLSSSSTERTTPRPYRRGGADRGDPEGPRPRGPPHEVRGRRPWPHQAEEQDRRLHGSGRVPDAPRLESSLILRKI